MSNRKFGLIIWEFFSGLETARLLNNLIMCREKHPRVFSYLSFPRATEDNASLLQNEFLLLYNRGSILGGLPMVDQKNQHPSLLSDVSLIETIMVVPNNLGVYQGKHCEQRNVSIVHSSIDQIPVKSVYPLEQVVILITSGRKNGHHTDRSTNEQVGIPKYLLQTLLRKLVLKPKRLERERRLFCSILTITSMHPVSAVIPHQLKQTPWLKRMPTHCFAEFFCVRSCVWLAWGSLSYARSVAWITLASVAGEPSESIHFPRL